MKIETTRRFDRQYAKLVRANPGIRPAMHKTLQLLERFPPAHPSLRFKRVRGTDGLYECSVNMDIRITLEFVGNDTFLLRNIDHHDPAFRR